MPHPAPAPRTSRRPRRFYAHLVTTLAAQLIIAIVALATHRPTWALGLFIASTLGLAAHAALVFTPTGPSTPPRRRTP